MNLSFKTTFPKEAGTLARKPTYFVEKIWASFSAFKSPHLNPSQTEYILKLCEDKMMIKENTQPKLHTIRYDPHNRWKASNKIHFWINARTKQQFQFAPVVPCVSTQEIEIKYNVFELKSRPEIVLDVIIDGQLFYYQSKVLGSTQQFVVDRMLQLALNDGFDTIEDFFQYFNTDFKGKIIHWTNLKY